jgi:hypothetical protein
VLLAQMPLDLEDDVHVRSAVVDMFLERGVGFPEPGVGFPEPLVGALPGGHHVADRTSDEVRQADQPFRDPVGLRRQLFEICIELRLLIQQPWTLTENPERGTLPPWSSDCAVSRR